MIIVGIGIIVLLLAQLANYIFFMGMTFQDAQWFIRGLEFGILICAFWWGILDWFWKPQTKKENEDEISKTARGD